MTERPSTLLQSTDSLGKFEVERTQYGVLLKHQMSVISFDYFVNHGETATLRMDGWEELLMEREACEEQQDQICASFKQKDQFSNE